jgi:hypothetical protein
MIYGWSTPGSIIKWRLQGSNELSNHEAEDFQSPVIISKALCMS